MEDEFGYPGTARLMIKDVSLYEAKQYKDKLEAVDGVDQILLVRQYGKYLFRRGFYTPEGY